MQQGQHIAGQPEKADQTAMQEGNVNIQPRQRRQKVGEHQQDAAGQCVDTDLPEPADGCGDQLDEQDDGKNGDYNTDKLRHKKSPQTENFSE